MRIANIDNRAAIVVDGKAIDIATASEGRFGSAPEQIYAQWADFTAWAATIDATESVPAPIDRSALGAPSPRPRQVFAIGLNYDEHARESGLETPTDLPPIFTKYVSSFSGPDSTVVIPEGGNVDWEIELVAVIGIEARNVAETAAWSHVAGLTAGQDISERISQIRGPAAQFGLAKSFPGFSPQGPWLVTPDEFANPDDLELGCSVDGEQVQRGRTSDMIFGVPKAIAALSENVTLYPGDVIFTGTPPGVGMGRKPQRFLRPGEKLDSWIEGIGELHQTFAAENS